MKAYFGFKIEIVRLKTKTVPPSFLAIRQENGQFLFSNLHSEEISFMSYSTNTLCAFVSQIVRVRVLFAAFAFLFCLSAAQNAQAQLTLTVTRSDDPNPDPNMCFWS